MPSNGLFLIGTHLMILAHVHSFVLLTANFDDVKKLAQKFVSDSLADTIADFVAKATGNEIDKRTSKEMIPKSRYYLDSDSVSDEDKDTNITKESISKENMKYRPKTLKSKIHQIRFQSKFMNASVKRSKKEKEKIEKNKGNKKLNMGYVPKFNSFKDFAEDSAHNNVYVGSKAGYDEKVSDKDLTSDQDEEPASDYALNNKFKEKHSKIDKPATLTTRKEKSEFDQYYNPNYSKAVATSGIVTLKRLLDSQKSRYRDQHLSDNNESS